MKNFFLEEDYISLNKDIEKKRNMLIKIGEDIKISCEQSSETWHDNFDYEEAKRRQRLVMNELNNLLITKENSELVSFVDDKVISIGSTVEIKDLDSGNYKEFIIGSFIPYKTDKRYISYVSPLAEKMIGLKINDKFSLNMAKKKDYKIISIK